MNSVLVLGAGLGSMVYVLRKRGYNPRYTLVENDKVILRWAMEFLGEDSTAAIEPICDDAMIFMGKNTAKYDLVFIDIFKGREVPDFVFTPLFLTHCRNSLAPGGRLAFNYIINDPQQWEQVKNRFTSVFLDNKILDDGINRILISRGL